MTEEPTDLAAELAPAVREQVVWVLGHVNGGADTEELPPRFAPAFLKAVPADRLDALVRTQVRPAGPFRITAVEEHRPTGASLLLQGTSVAVRMQISVEDVPPHRIAGLLFQPATQAVAPLSSWDELGERLRRSAGTVALLAVEIVDGRCEPIHAVDADRVLPLGSAFKLYVLGALAGEIAAGRASWDETVVLTDADRVHTSMHLGTRPAGTSIPLREVATSMISVSDNTATDLVMARVGRDAIEAVLAPMGMADPSATLPFLTTAEVTRLKWLGPPDVRSEYATASVDRRRELLTELEPVPVTDDAVVAAMPAGPVAVDTIEWFASAADLCRAHLALREMGPEVRAALTQNAGQGLEIDRARWPEIAFKGGSEPGVIAASWSMTRDDGRVFSLVVLLMDAERDIPITAVLDAAAAFDLLAAIR